MILRSITPSLNSSFFVFGARGTGKTTWLKDFFKDKKPLWINLLDDEQESELAHNPSLLSAKIHRLPKDVKWVVIDEIQKVPKLLDVVHQEIEKKKSSLR